jgi:hypothetical protein
MRDLNEAQAAVDKARWRISQEKSCWAEGGWLPRMRTAQADLHEAQLRRELALARLASSR